MATSDMRPDVKAYMIQAATEIAKEQAYIPESEEALGTWMLDNRVAIIERTSELQQKLFDKINRHGVKDRVATIISTQIWRDVRFAAIKEQSDRAINEALEENHQVW